MLIIRIISLGPLVYLASSALKQLDFKKMSEEGLLHSDHVMFDSPARSKLSCLELCALTDCCVRFTYTGKGGTPGTCRGHSTQLLQSEQGTIAQAATSYVWTSVRDVTGLPSNVALNKVASQSSDLSGSSGLASAAVDGNHDPDYEASWSCTATEAPGVSWWQVDLGDGTSGYDVISVIVTNRGDCCPQRLRDFDVHVHTENPATNQSASGAFCFHYDGPMGAGVTEELMCCRGPMRGRFVRVTNTPGEILTLCEVQVMAVPAV